MICILFQFKLEDQTGNRPQTTISQAALQPTSNAILDASKMPVIPVAAARRILPVSTVAGRIII